MLYAYKESQQPNTNRTLEKKKVYIIQYKARLPLKKRKKFFDFFFFYKIKGR